MISVTQNLQTLPQVNELMGAILILPNVQRAIRSAIAAAACRAGEKLYSEYCLFVSNSKKLAILLTAREAEAVADKEMLTNEQKRQSVVEKMWLHYFNNQLLEQGMITQTQHRKMKVKINSRKPSA